MNMQAETVDHMQDNTLNHAMRSVSTLPLVLEGHC